MALLFRILSNKQLLNRSDSAIAEECLQDALNRHAVPNNASMITAYGKFTFHSELTRDFLFFLCKFRTPFLLLRHVITRRYIPTILLYSNLNDLLEIALEFCRHPYEFGRILYLKKIL
jgi:hypothetical protein